MFNFSSNEYKMQRTRDRVMEERLRKDNKVSNYKSDNDIFGLKVNKPIEEGKFYRKTAKEIYESRIDKKFRVKITFTIFVCFYMMIYFHIFRNLF
jgi:hypothetical protein